MTRNILYKSYSTKFGTLKAKPPLAFAGQRIGLLGGSFNPPHAAHILISNTVYRRLGLDAVWWIVSPGNPLKSHHELELFKNRVDLCRTLASHPKIKATSFEGNLSTPYSTVTISFLKQRYPAVKFVWLMGADNLATFHMWHDWEGIVRKVPIAVVGRPGWHLQSLAGQTAKLMARYYIPEFKSQVLMAKQPPVWTFLTGKQSVLSSTIIRMKRGGMLMNKTS
ncbi:MAG: nicotinate-nucleotide adenylyltransferase [Hyphomicrobiaceae bacterium]|nr:nicotinate-nucleotide adenylyltransferase [Hyphomicrobiaceae bacterium]